jgi:hypothetical protein
MMMTCQWSLVMNWELDNWVEVLQLFYQWFMALGSNRVSPGNSKSLTELISSFWATVLLECTLDMPLQKTWNWQLTASNILPPKISRYLYCPLFSKQRWWVQKVEEVQGTIATWVLMGIHPFRQETGRKHLLFALYSGAGKTRIKKNHSCFRQEPCSQIQRNPAKMEKGIDVECPGVAKTFLANRVLSPNKSGNGFCCRYCLLFPQNPLNSRLENSSNWKIQDKSSRSHLTHLIFFLSTLFFFIK